MSKILLNKSFLQKQRNQLSLYKKLLPSLELKRSQLMMELNKNRQLLVQSIQNYQTFIRQTGQEIPMLANQKIDHSDLIKIDTVEIISENIVGVKLPLLKEILFEKVDYPVLGKPAWSEMFINRYKKGIKLNLEVSIVEKRIGLLEKVLKKTTQRVNLFEKVLIPETKEQIKMIQIALDDIQRTSVARSKIAKSKQKELPWQ